MPREWRDPYSKAKLFIPTTEEKTVKELESKYKSMIKEASQLLKELKAQKGDS